MHAADTVGCYAAYRARHVGAGDVLAICRALGEISIEEAFDALDRLEAEATMTFTVTIKDT